VKKHSGPLPDKKPSRAPILPATDPVFLPALPGFDQAEALKVLNNNSRLYVKMLYEFQKSYGSLPTLLRELSGTGKWPEIERLAHTIKGVSAYIGASFLRKSAQQLEDALKKGQKEAAGDLLVFFIDDLDSILSSLSTLSPPESDTPGQVDNTTLREIIDQEAREPIQVLIGQLKRGEAASEEQFQEVRQILAGTGFDGQLQKIAELMDDIEYEGAVEQAEALLKTLEQKVRAENE
jgi:HPt (histidine-containing phosphotransfer) domain-containing protein